MLHLFDKPDQGPTLDELLEGFWGGKDMKVWDHDAEDPTVWTLTRIYPEEKGDDSFYFEVFHCKEAALWSHWFEALEEAFSFDKYFDDITPTQWLADTLTEIQNLRDDEFHEEFGYVLRLEEKRVQ